MKNDDRRDKWMKNYILRKLLLLIPLLLGITFLTFAMMHLAGGDAVSYFYENAGTAVSQDVLDAARHKYGLDRPFGEQYLSWLEGMLTGHMGISYVSQKPVFDTFISKLPHTLYLAFTAMVMTLAVSVPLGIYAASHHDRLGDYVLRFLSFGGISVPGFLMALILIYFLSVKFHLFPAVSDNTLSSVFLPALTLALPMSARYTRQVRSRVLEELGKEYVTGARERGIPEKVILWKSVLPSSFLSIMPLLFMSLGSLLGGTAVVETIFMWDGAGKLAVDAIMMRDYPLIQAYVVWMAVIYTLVNLCCDCLCERLDPRMGKERRGE